MKQGWRWFGPKDPISLKEIRQAGVTDIVTALHDRECGEVWPPEEIQARQIEVAKAGMVWTVVESLPVHESIKTRTGDFHKHIENYKNSLCNLAACGIKVVCYNFMPVLDWTRSNLARELPDGSTVLQYDDEEVAAFDLYMLERPGAAGDYSPEVRARAKALFKSLSDAQRKRLADSILLGLPGTVNDLTIPEFRDLLGAYADIGDHALRNNLYAFLNEIRPLCDQLGIRMAIHPDDPPHPIFGLPRVMSTDSDFREMCAKVPSDNIGFTFCAGSVGCNPEADEVAMFREFAQRIHFVHLRNVVCSEGRSFRESGCHLTGKIDMPRLMRLLGREELRRGEAIVVRPDHGRAMEIDKKRSCYSGYSYGGRLVGLAELRGLEFGLRHGNDIAGKVVVWIGVPGVLYSPLIEDLLFLGAKVAIVDMSGDHARHFCESLASKGLPNTIAVEANILDKTSLEAARCVIVEKWGHIDILINGSEDDHSHIHNKTSAEQTLPDAPLDQTVFGPDVADCEFANNASVLGMLHSSQVFFKSLRKNRDGAVLNLYSMTAFQTGQKVEQHDASKFSLRNTTAWLAKQLAPMGVRVNAISLGFFITEQNRFLMPEKDGKSLTACGNEAIAKTPMRKLGQPNDIFGAARFLISDEAQFVTGVVLPVDGGFFSLAQDRLKS